MVELETQAERDVLFVAPERVTAIQAGYVAGTSLLVLEGFSQPLGVMGDPREVHQKLFPPEASR